MASKIRRLFWDIETSPNVCLSFRIGYNVTLLPESIVKERAIICIGYKWEDDDHVTVLRWDAHQNDKALLKAFVKVANEADEMVAYNGDRYDIGWFRTRLLKHGYTPRPGYKTVDPLQWAKRLLNFNSNKLDYVAQYLGVGKKHKTGFDLWKRIAWGRDADALKQMCDYCAQDVRVLEKVWAKLRLIAPAKTHAGVLAGGDRWTCPHCGSANVQKHKTRYTAAGTAYHQMVCKDCGAFFSITEGAYKKYLKAKHRHA